MNEYQHDETRKANAFRAWDAMDTRTNPDSTRDGEWSAGFDWADTLYNTLREVWESVHTDGETAKSDAMYEAARSVADITYTHQKWMTFADTQAYREDDNASDYGAFGSADDLAYQCLEVYAERAAIALFSEWDSEYDERTEPVRVVDLDAARDAALSWSGLIAEMHDAICALLGESD